MDSYTKLPELLSMLGYSKRVLAKITDRRANNQMFIRMDDSAIKDIYNKSSRLFMYIDMLETYLICSPLYPELLCICDTTTNYESDTISDDLRTYYKKIYNRLFTCLQLLIESIPSDWYGGIKYEADECLTLANERGENPNTPIDPVPPCEDVLGSFDMSFDFSFDVGDLCDSPTPPTGSKVYVGTSSSYAPNETEVKTFAYQEMQDDATGSYSFAAGDHKVFAFPATFNVLGFLDNGSSTPIAMDLSYTPVVTANTTFSYHILAIDGVDYRIYRTLNSLAGTIVIKVE